MKNPISLLALLFGITAAFLLLIPSIRAEVTWEMIILFGVFFIMLLAGTVLDYWGDRDTDFWKRIRQSRLFKTNHS
jgi:4-hydroxybenzoate polyprenyltransferase